MKLRRRSRANGSAGSRLPQSRGERQPPPSVLTTWLRQGLRSGMCPLCRVAHKADREYIWHFFDEGSDRGETLDTVSRAYGFCAEHIEMLRRIEVDGMKSTLSISILLSDVLAAIDTDLDRLNPTLEFQPAQCPACGNRDERLQANAKYLLDELATTPARKADYETSPGLCFDHFALVWDSAESLEDRQLILDVQRACAHRLLGELREHVRKQEHRFSHEPKGAERDSWQRAIWLTAGWPPRAGSAAEPEDTS